MIVYMPTLIKTRGENNSITKENNPVDNRHLPDIYRVVFSKECSGVVSLA
jgi:hypothetical protein